MQSNALSVKPPATISFTIQVDGSRPLHSWVFLKCCVSVSLLCTFVTYVTLLRGLYFVYSELYDAFTWHKANTATVCYGFASTLCRGCCRSQICAGTWIRSYEYFDWTQTVPRVFNLEWFKLLKVCYVSICVTTNHTSLYNYW